MTVLSKPAAGKVEATPAPRKLSAISGSAMVPANGFWDQASRIRPGVNSVRVGFVLFVLSIVNFALPSLALVTLIALLAVALLVAAGLELRAVIAASAKLKVRRSLPSVVGRNAAFSIVWEIDNENDAELSGDLRDVVPSQALPRFETHSFQIAARRGRVPMSQACRIVERGKHSFGPVWIRIFGPYRLVEFQAPFGALATVKVLPEQFASREELQKDRGAELRLLDKATRTRQHGSGTEFESLTEFREGDDPRRIDWRATARIQRPVVRRFQIERHRDVMILVDCGRLMGTQADNGTKLDCAVDAALILARVALQSGDRCGIGVYDSEVRRYLPPVTGAKSLHALTDSVYAIQSDFRESDFSPMFATLQSRQAKRSLIVVLSDVSDAETSQQFRASLGRLGRRHVVLFAALRTPLLYRILREPVDSIIDGAKKAVTFRLMRERQMSLQSLKHAGVFVLDVEPNELTLPLVNQFIELRQRNLL